MLLVVRNSDAPESDAQSTLSFNAHVVGLKPGDINSLHKRIGNGAQIWTPREGTIGISHDHISGRAFDGQ